MPYRKLAVGAVAGLIAFYEYTPHLGLSSCDDAVCAAPTRDKHSELGPHIEWGSTSTSAGDLVITPWTGSMRING